MNSASKYAVVALLVIFITGCAEKKTKVVPPAQSQAPSIDAGKTGAMYPPPLTPPQPQVEQPNPEPPPVVAETPPPQEEPPPTTAKKTPPASSTRKTKPSPAKPSTPASGDTADASGTTAPPPGGSPAADPGAEQHASNGEAPATSPIGQLSTGDVAGRPQTRKETVDLITNTENGLNGIKRALNAQEQETANQIKSFLTKARQALTNDDLDGAFILATKAKVLLDELNKT